MLNRTTGLLAIYHKAVGASMYRTTLTVSTRVSPYMYSTSWSTWSNLSQTTLSSIVTNLQHIPFVGHITISEQYWADGSAAYYVYGTLTGN